ncbi:kinesin light chain 1 [Phaeosphaeria sp. MPI-PUGE-AT-0046c]|nr:kinesin light chain 1 [Phaeosphaeria sp. MPI-PUGE-AT-0046c]
MRLLHSLPGGNLELIRVDADNPPPYAILSHTWTEGQEVTYHELMAGTGTHKDGYEKIRFCGEQAASDRLEYFWVDTCCINKSTSDELSTAINSMFRWYQRATKCYVYLSDVSLPGEVYNASAFKIAWVDAFRRSRWFTRGWTLQELIAPASVEFFSKERKTLGTKVSLEQEISIITNIPVEVLRGQRSPAATSIDERMSWAAQRTTTLKEDKVYCLLGIFGVFLPLIYGEGEEYATLRLREEIQKRQQGAETSNMHEKPASWSLPFPRNEHFIGRDNELLILEQSLLSPTTHQRIAVYGLGGCGKSALAVEFAYRTIERHTGHLVFWVPAVSQESFELAYREIGSRLRLPGLTEENCDVKKLVNQALSAESIGNWVMIVDNADDPTVLLRATNDASVPTSQWADYLPHSNRGSILFTTRSRKIAGYFTPSGIIELEDMSKADAEHLLAQRVTKQIMIHDKGAVGKLLELLTYLPLAIVQAAAFINNNGISATEYLSLFQQSTEMELFSEQFNDTSRYRELDSTIAKTWHISFEQIRKKDPLAAEYLSMIACFDRINIPQSLFAGKGSPIQQVKALGTLTGYAFLTERQTAKEDDNDRRFDMHRLVHLASVWWLEGSGQRPYWVDKAAAQLEKLVPCGGHEKQKVWTKYLPHVIHLTRLDSVMKETAKAVLLHRLGRCQNSLGHYSSAEATFRQLMLLRQRELGSDHADTMTSMTDLATTLQKGGKFQEAEVLSRQALARYEKVPVLLGLEHPETLTTMSILASLLSEQGKPEEAEPLHRQVLDQRRKILGSEHPSTLSSMGNLATNLDRQGKYDEAETLNRQTLTQSERVCGPEHPYTLHIRSNLAYVLNSQDKFTEAEEIILQTLSLREKSLGPNHPDTILSVYILGLCLASQHRYDESIVLFRRAYAGNREIFGANHPETSGVHDQYLAAIAARDRSQIG